MRGFNKTAINQTPHPPLLVCEDRRNPFALHAFSLIGIIQNKGEMMFTALHKIVTCCMSKSSFQTTDRVLNKTAKIFLNNCRFAANNRLLFRNETSGCLKNRPVKNKLMR